MAPSTPQKPGASSSIVKAFATELEELELELLEEMEELLLDELEIIEELLLLELLLEVELLEELTELVDELVDELEDELIDDELLALILPAPAAPPTILGISAALSKL